MNITLLTHQRELNKPTNTGKLVAEVLNHESRILVWERKKPNEELLQQIENTRVALIYPSDDSDLVSNNEQFDGYIVLDATWQEAQKMVNQSPYLKRLPKLQIEASAESIYNLRRNQKHNGLCTAECVIELLKAKNLNNKAEQLQSRLVEFLADY
jgi:DTW domain-containing protein YfiP